jgi:hypothetical protein
MGQKKLLNKEELSALLTVAEEDGDVIDADVFDSDVPNFLISANIEQGEYLAHQKSLYDLYVSYSPRPLSVSLFFLQLRLYLPRKDQYFFVNKTSLELLKALASSKKKRTTLSHFAKKQFDLFIKEHEIESGELWIEEKKIESLFDRWVLFTRKKRTVSKAALVSFMSVFFENRITKKGRLFKIKEPLTSAELEKKACEKKPKEKKIVR